MDKYLFVFMILFAGCTYIQQESGFTEFDYKIKKEGYYLKCTDYRDGRCAIADWINGTDTTNNTVLNKEHS